MRTCLGLLLFSGGIVAALGGAFSVYFVLLSLSAHHRPLSAGDLFALGALAAPLPLGGLAIWKGWRMSVATRPLPADRT